MTVEDIQERLLEQGFEDAVIFTDPAYADAFIGVSTDGRAVYSYHRMVLCLVNEGWDSEEARDNIEYNTIRSLDYEPKAPIVVYDE